MRSRIFWAASTAVVALLLAGCTGIPYTGGVNKGVPVADVSTSDIQYLPAGPAVDSSPEQILEALLMQPRARPVNGPLLVSILRPTSRAPGTPARVLSLTEAIGRSAIKIRPASP